MKIVDDRRLVQVGELSHVVGFVELGRIDLVDRFAVHLVLRAIIALHKELAPVQFFDNPATHKSRLGISEPDIALAREVVLALNPPHFRYVLSLVGDELRGKRAGGGAIPVRIRPQPRRVATCQWSAQLGEGLVPRMSHVAVWLDQRRRYEGRLRTGCAGRRARRWRGRVPGEGTVAPSRAVGRWSAHSAGVVRAGARALSSCFCATHSAN
ncbi:hypothetical protein K491DRAFT_377940 [Lophiostoma macrostomum CBS 122681]|uniref:Uncharacterized protein n=1 Tax=Lophiostoma macrostomum CBS 122681 TaxID=1314788 RepID=A0A6A6TAZ3_9PLEO|nr:hypothetical protein K491DRAFT_377940 [Lophiostoma macrostomum CBS 122681]